MYVKSTYTEKRKQSEKEYRSPGTLLDRQEQFQI